MNGFCQCSPPKPRRDGGGKVVCVNSGCHKEVKTRGENVDTMRKDEIEVIERKTRAMIALGEEVLNRLREMKAQ